MVFSSLLFLFRFLPVVLLIYYVMPKKGRNLVLFVASLFFYAWGEPVYVVLILFSSLVDYTAGRAVAYWKEKGRKKRAMAAVCCSAVINLALLGFFKYGDFFLGIFHSLTGVPVAKLNLPLPIGISFYTFQTMSYTIDVYRGDAKMQKNLITFGAYVSLFPQLIAGPIIRYKDVAEQLDERKETLSLFCRGILRFVIGLGKKVLIANQIGALWQEIEGKKRDTPARFMFPIFLSEDLLKTMIGVCGDFRWEMTKTEQGVHWNDLSDPSLTSEYSDYIQYYRKNHDLSLEQKEKVKKILQKSGNNLRKTFVTDYYVYMISESNGSPLMNKVTRSILFNYCPFTEEIRNKLKMNPQYTELLNRYHTHQEQKLRPLMNIIRRVEKQGDQVPQELMEEIDHLKR